MRNYVKSPAAAGLVAVFALFCAWTAFQVSAADAALFIGYELAFVLIPGVLAYIALTGVIELGLRQLAVGAALGFALGLAAFVLTAATGTRSWFVAYPCVVIVAAGAAVFLQARRGSRVQRVSLAPQRWPWVLCGLFLVVVAYVLSVGFIRSPAPTLSKSASYFPDMVWSMSLTAEARHHWPLQVPNIVGTPLHYHYFSFLDMAGINQVTGIPIFDIVFRLWYPALLLLVALQFVYAGRFFGRSNAAGLVGVGLFFLVGAAIPVPALPGTVFRALTLSTSFVYGLVFFIPLTTEIARFVRRDADEKFVRVWPVVAALALAAAGAKASILPVVLVALGLAGIWALLKARSLIRRIVVVAVTAAFAAGVGGFWLYPHAHGGLSIAPLQIIKEEQPFALLIAHDHHFGPATWVIVAIGAVLGTLKLLESLLLGFLGVWLSRRTLREFDVIWLTALLLGSLFFYYVFVHPGESQAYFYVYGYAAGCILSGIGIVALWRRLMPSINVPVFAAAAGIALFAVLAIIDQPLDGSPKVFWRWWTGRSTFYCCRQEMTPALYEGLTWLKAHSEPNDVLVVNNQWNDPAGTEPLYFYYSAFAERRVLIEGSYNGSGLTFADRKTVRAGQFDYQGRFALTDAIFERASRSALREAEQRYGVTYIVADKLHGATPQVVRNAELLGTRVFANSAVVIVKASAIG